MHPIGFRWTLFYRMLLWTENVCFFFENVGISSLQPWDPTMFSPFFFSFPIFCSISYIIKRQIFNFHFLRKLAPYVENRSWFSHLISVIITIDLIEWPAIFASTVSHLFFLFHMNFSLYFFKKFHSLKKCQNKAYPSPDQLYSNPN